LPALADFDVRDTPGMTPFCPQRDKTAKATIPIVAGSDSLRPALVSTKRHAKASPNGWPVRRLNNESKINRGPRRGRIFGRHWLMTKAPLECNLFVKAVGGLAWKRADRFLSCFKTTRTI